MDDGVSVGGEAFPAGLFVEDGNKRGIGRKSGSGDAPAGNWAVESCEIAKDDAIMFEGEDVAVHIDAAIDIGADSGKKQRGAAGPGAAERQGSFRAALMSAQLTSLKFWA